MSGGQKKDFQDEQKEDGAGEDAHKPAPPVTPKPEEPKVPDHQDQFKND